MLETYRLMANFVCEHALKVEVRAHRSGHSKAEVFEVNVDIRLDDFGFLACRNVRDAQLHVGRGATSRWEAA